MAGIEVNGLFQNTWQQSDKSTRMPLGHGCSCKLLWFEGRDARLRRRCNLDGLGNAPRRPQEKADKRFLTRGPSVERSANAAKRNSPGQERARKAKEGVVVGYGRLMCLHEHARFLSKLQGTLSLQGKASDKDAPGTMLDALLSLSCIQT